MARLTDANVALAREIIAAAGARHPGLDAGRLLSLLDGSPSEPVAGMLFDSAA